jgi:nucleoside-diphosphate-sugar epimerase
MACIIWGRVRLVLSGIWQAIHSPLWGWHPISVFIDTPEDIRDTYQYFTEANMDKLKKAGYDTPFHSLEDGIADYVKHYLREEEIM